MLKDDLVYIIQEELLKKEGFKKNDFSKKKIHLVLDAFFKAVMNNVANGEPVKLVGFGTYEVKIRNEQEKKNPKTGEKVIVRKHSVPSFRPSETFIKSCSETYKIVEKKKN